MKKRLLTLGAAGLAAAALGVAYASTVGSDRPTRLLNPQAELVYVAGPDGEALTCNGKLVQVKRSALGGAIPPLTPQQAAGKSARPQPGVKVARCEKGPNGRETGRVVFVPAEGDDAP